MKSSKSRAVEEKKRSIIAFALEPLAVNRFCYIMELAILSQIMQRSYAQALFKKVDVLQSSVSSSNL